MCFFFVKQKTAYEMRISDWSSDVCSSDLWLSLLMLVSASAQAADLAVTRVESSVFVRHANGDHAALSNRDPLQAGDTVSTGAQGHVSMRLAGGGSLLLGPNVALQIDSTKPPEPPARATLANLILNSGALHVRSEEHTSELQSLMRNSYDVFYLRQQTK